MSGLIRRADAIEAICGTCSDEYTYDKGHYKECNCYVDGKCPDIEALEALPSADAEMKCVAQIEVDTEEIAKRIREEYDITDSWIPCSERLPKEKQEVYVTVYFIEGDTGRAYGYMDGFGKWHLCSTVEGTLNSGYEVIAWMPLPMPYREGGEDE